MESYKIFPFNNLYFDKVSFLQPAFLKKKYKITFIVIIYIIKMGCFICQNQEVKQVKKI